MILQLPSLCAALFLVLAAGAGLIALLSPRSLRSSERLALSWIVGGMAVSFALWLGSFFLRGPLLQAGVSLGCLALGLLDFARRGTNLGDSRRPSGVEKILWGLLFIQFAAILYTSFSHTLGWDGLLNWEFKARIALENGGALPSSYLADREWAFSHQEYPLGIPNLELWFYLWLGEANQFWAKLIFPLFYAAGAVLLAAFVARLTRNFVLGLSAALLLGFVPQFLVIPGAATTGYADFPLAVLYLAAIGSLLLAREDEGWFGVAVFCLTFLPWLKREGVVLWASGAVAAFVFCPNRRRFGALLPLAGGFLLFLGWQFYLQAHHVSAPADFARLNAGAQWQHLDRLGAVLLALTRNLADSRAWTLLWEGALAAFVVLFCQGEVRRASFFLFALLPPLCFDVAVYLFSAWPDYLRHLNLSLSRLLLQLAPTAALLGSLGAGHLLAGSSKSRNSLRPVEEASA